MPRIHRLLLGIVCGWVLSRLRLVPGGVWLDGPALDASSALLVRGAALAFVGVSLGSVRRGLGIDVLLGLALGFAFHGLVWPRPMGLPALDVLLVAVVLGVLTALVRRDEARRSEPEPAAAHIGERIGLFLAGGGAAVVLEVVARHLRLLGGGLQQDDSAFGAVFVVLLALGGACFGWATGLARVERWALPWCLAAVAAAGYWSLGTIAGIGQIHEFNQFVRRYGLDTSWHGTLAVDALIAGAVLVVPAFLLGIALRGARGAGSLSSALVGAGVGLALLPRILHRDPGAASNVSELFSAQLLPFGLLAALLGAGLALLSVPGRSSRARWIAFACALPLGAPILLVETKPLFVLSPWQRFATMPFLAFETPEGLATVEPGDGGLKLATLDRAQLSPGVEGTRADSRAIEASFLALAPSVRDAREVRVLLVGQLTQARAAAFTRAGAARIDRTAAWHAAMPRLDGELLAEYPVPPGDAIDPSEAERRLENGDYDLCVALAIDGDPPRWKELSAAPQNTVCVRWSRIEEPLLARLPGSRFAGSEDREPLYAIAGGGLEHLMIGVLDGAVRPSANEAGRLEFVRFEGSPPQPAPLARLSERKNWRGASATAAFTAAIAAQNEGPLWRGIDAFAGAQVPSSPFETESQQIELEDEVLEELRAAALASPPSAFTRETWNWLARILAGKRDIAAIEKYLPALAERWAPWPELEVALARADLEALDPEAAIRRLTPLSKSSNPLFEVWTVLGEAFGQVGDHSASASAWARAWNARPAESWIERKWTVARVRAGDPDAVEGVRRWLEAHPEDEDMRVFLGPGPWSEAHSGPSTDAHPH